MILIAIGGNLPADDGRPARTTCEQAANAVSHLPGLHGAILSRWYESTPVPPSGQPAYVNGVLRLEGVMDPATLLQALQQLETRHGRRRSVPNAARTLDLDIIAMDGIVRDAPDPVLPHPRMAERAFVLQPLLDVAAHWVHPILGVSARVLLARLDRGDLRLLAPPPLQGSDVRPT